jgi:hypothetical protein
LAVGKVEAKEGKIALRHTEYLYMALHEEALLLLKPLAPKGRQSALKQ